jgi:putative CocE/NonD family hydrolase
MRCTERRGISIPIGFPPVVLPPRPAAALPGLRPRCAILGDSGRDRHKPPDRGSAAIGCHICAGPAPSRSSRTGIIRFVIEGAQVVRATEDVEVLKNVRIPMRDGIRLAADLYVPAGFPRGGPLPVVMDYLPYRKDEVDPASARHYLALARAGYVLARVDIRGTGASEGWVVDEYVAQEQVDGYDAVEWLAARPWCDGHVNLMGSSYGGFTALQVATHRPPHLTSIIPIYATDDRYTDDCHYRGGLLRMYYDPGWYGTRMVAWNAMPPASIDDEEEGRAIWERHLSEDQPYLLEWLRHQVDGPYWRQGSVAGALDSIRCPTFIIGGWADGYPNPPLRLFAGIQAPVKVLVGPWNHALPDTAVPGPRIDYLREVVRWLDHWCRGLDTGIMRDPPITVFVQEPAPLDPARTDTPGTWRSEARWPAPGASERVLGLASDSRLAAGDDAAADAADGSDTFRYDASVGTAGGLWSGGVPFGLPSDQRHDEARSVVYTTEPLPQAVTILGRARAIIWVSSTASVIGFAVSLSDVSEDGTSQLIGKGMLNATRRRSLAEPEPLVPGEPVELALEIDATAWRFAAGHRIRVAIASADFPNVWPTPEPAINTIWRGPAHPSRIVLPVVPDDGSATAPTFAPSTVDVPPLEDGDQAAAWTVTTDQLRGSVAVTIERDTKHTLPDGTLIERDSGCICEVHPADPATASARGWHRARTTRDGRWTEAKADVVIQGTAAAFDLAIDLVVTVDGAVHATRRWQESIPRALL